MEVVKNQIDDLNASIIVNVANSDVEETVSKTLKDYRRKANIPGFRPGNAPMGLIKKMYETPVRVDELNKLVSKAVTDYISDNKLNVLGDPLPNDSQKQIDLEKDETYSFVFDIALAPEFEVSLSKRDKLNKYSIIVSDKMVEEHVNMTKQKYASLVDLKKSSSDSMLSVSLIELNSDGEPKENGINMKDVSISLKVVKDEKIQKELTGIKPNTIVDIDLKEAFPNETELSALLKHKKEDLANINNVFRLTVNTIKEYKEAELTQELFDKLYGEATINSEEEFINRVKTDLGKVYKQDIYYRLMLDIKEKLIKKTNFELPEEFLKRWLKATNKDITDEQIQNEFPRFIEDLKWTLIKSNIAKANDIKVNEEDLVKAAKSQILAQFVQYGIVDIPEDILEKYAKETLTKQEEVNKLYENAVEDKVIDFVSEAVKLEDKEISFEDFSKLFENLES